MRRRRAAPRTPWRLASSLVLAIGLLVPLAAGAAHAAGTTIDTFIDSRLRSPGNNPTPTFSFHASIAGSTFQCQVDGSDPFPCSSPYTTDPLDEGFHSFSVWATDPSGNVDTSPVNVFFEIDLTPPDTVLYGGPSDPTNNPSPQFSFYSTEFPERFQCQMDGATFAPCTNPYVSAPLADGTHTFTVRAMDRATNVDPTPPSWTFTVDTVPPVASIDSHPATLSNDPAPSFGFSSNEAGSTFACDVDGAGYAPCSSPVSPAGLPDGSHTFSVVATDLAGNVGAPASFTWTLDTVPPETWIDSGPVSPTMDTTPTFAFSATEAGSTFECSLDGSAWTACSSTVTTDSLAGGDHTFAVRATDPAGNTDPTPAVQTFTVETGPSTVFVQTPDPHVSRGTVHFRGQTSPLQPATFQCYLAPMQRGWAPCSAGRSGLLVVNYSGLAPGVYTFHTRATDLQGGVGPAIAYTFTVS